MKTAICKIVQKLFGIYFAAIKRALNASEKQMLDNARKMMISEVALVQNVSEHQATEYLQDTMNH